MRRPLIAAVFLSCCLTLVVKAQENAGPKPENRSESGTLNGAAFRVDIPGEWNNALVLYCHGYLPEAVPPNVNDLRINLLRNSFVTRGYAFALSAYRAQGWAVKEAIEDTEALRQHFISKYGKPRETYIVGHSMGAVVALASMEGNPKIYNGALPLCGPLDIILRGFQERIFDMLVTFDFLYQGTIGPLANLPKGVRLDPAKIRTAIEAAPEKTTTFLKRYSLASTKDLIAVLPYYFELNRELQVRCGGNPFDNRNTIYDGFDDDVALNAGVKRYAADEKAREYLRQYYTPTGRISRPVLALHTIYDPFVLPRYLGQYDLITRIAGTQDLFVAKYVAARGHCNFTLPQTIGAFEQLVNWARDGKKPEPGESK